MITWRSANDLGVSRETTRRQDIGFVGLGATIGKQRLGELPTRRDQRDLLCDRSLWLGGEQGRDTLERIELPIDLRVDFVIRAADAPVCDDAPEKIEVLLARRPPTRTDLWPAR